MKTRLFLAVAVGCNLLALSSCVRRNPRGVALYSPSAATTSSSTVVQLIGPIRSVDGKDVDGTTFELLPGCHVVEIGGLEHHIDPRVGGEIGTLPRLVYAVWMTAGHTYVVELSREPDFRSGPVSQVRILLREQDVEGRVVATIAPATDIQTIEDCRAAATRLRPW
jgi:hypothetical protein